jgi:hypothetical protein
MRWRGTGVAGICCCLVIFAARLRRFSGKGVSGFWSFFGRPRPRFFVGGKDTIGAGELFRGLMELLSELHQAQLVVRSQWLTVASRVEEMQAAKTS